MSKLDGIDVRLVETWDDGQDFLAWLSQDRRFLGLDIETTGLNVGRDYIRLIQFGDSRAGWAMSWKDWRGLAKEVLHNYRGDIVAHNLLFEQKFLSFDGVPIQQRWAHDTMVMAHVQNPMQYLDLKGLASRKVDKKAKLGQGLLKMAFSGGGWDWETIPIDHPSYWVYSSLDACLTSMLAEELWSDVVPQREAYELELACIHVLRTAEVNGMTIDPDYTARAITQLQYELDVLRPQIPVNPNSDAQVRNMFLSAGVPAWPFLTDAGLLSCKKEALNFIAVMYPTMAPICELINTYRLKERYLTNYMVKLRDLAVDNVIRPSTRPLGARTSRMSVTDPPLQTLPRGRVVRDAFVAREGHKLLIADYSQMELRVMAHYANEEAMLAAFHRGEDLHDFVATNAYGAEFTKKQRQICKNAQFAKIYGAGVEKFAATAKIPVAEAAEFLQRYDKLFPGVSQWQEAEIRMARERAAGGRYGWTELVDGRRIPVEVAKAYTACNYRIQGSCAVVTKRKMVELANAGLEEFIRLAVHDELLFEPPEPLVEDVKPVIDRVMTDHDTFSVPIPAEAEVYGRWGEKYADEYESYLPVAA